MTNLLDPDPLNELGKGLMDPAIEAWLLRRGFVFAVRLPGGGYGGSCRRIAEAFLDGERDAHRRLLPLRATRATNAKRPAEIAVLCANTNQSPAGR